MILYEQRCGEMSTPHISTASFLPFRGGCFLPALGLAVTPGLAAAETLMHALSDGTMSFGGTLPALPPPVLQHGRVEGPTAPAPDAPSPQVTAGSDGRVHGAGMGRPGAGEQL